MSLLKDRVAIVSGVGPGLGLSIAKLFAKQGATVVLSARSKDRLSAMQSEIVQQGGKSLAVVCDIADPESCRALVAEVLQQCGRIDVLVNNAFNAGGFVPFEQARIDQSWATTFGVNVMGSLQLSQAVLPAMKEQGGGSIVMISSVSMCDYRSERPPVSDYAASKSALHTASKYLAGELGGYGIRVNTVRPGYIDGEALSKYFTSVGSSREQVAETLPLGRLPTPDDIAQAVLFYASDMSTAITGGTIDVNSGEYMS